MGGSILGMVFYLSFYSELSLVAGMVTGAALTYWVCRVVFNQRFCGIVKQWYLPVAAAALMLLGAQLLSVGAIAELLVAYQNRKDREYSVKKTIGRPSKTEKDAD
jgi:hypothetical protein